MFGVTKFRAAALANEGHRRELKQGRIPGEHISPARRLFPGPNSAPNSGGIPPIRPERVSGVQIPLSPPMSLRSSVFSGEAREIRACARVPAIVRAPERLRYDPVRADSADFSPRRGDPGSFADAGREGHLISHSIADRRARASRRARGVETRASLIMEWDRPCQPPG